MYLQLLLQQLRGLSEALVPDQAVHSLRYLALSHRPAVLQIQTH